MVRVSPQQQAGQCGGQHVVALQRGVHLVVQRFDTALTADGAGHRGAGAVCQHALDTTPQLELPETAGGSVDLPAVHEARLLQADGQQRGLGAGVAHVGR
ncbi:hypothetical protein D3C80_1525440 [compost metagenome]